jgi:hypothetical protein
MQNWHFAQKAQAFARTHDGIRLATTSPTRADVRAGTVGTPGMASINPSPSTGPAIGLKQLLPGTALPDDTTLHRIAAGQRHDTTEH